MRSRVLVLSLLTLFILSTGISLYVFADPCYRQTWTIKASERGCALGDQILPVGYACPGITFLKDVTERPLPTSCGTSIRENEIGIGTSGNEQTGYMEQGTVSRECYEIQFCELEDWKKIPWLPLGFPIVDNLYFRCNPSYTFDAGSIGSFEPMGAECQRE